MFNDGVMETSATLGLSDYILGGPVYNSRAFNEFFLNNDRCSYIVQTLDRTKYEIIDGVFQVGPPNKLTRATVIQSSNAGAKINWQAGDQYIIASYPSATVVGGITRTNLSTTRPWWVVIGQWLQKNFPSVNIHTLNFWDGTADIPMGTVDTVKHKIYWNMATPAGIIQAYAGTGVPDGYLICNGTSLLRANWPELFNAIGTTYGSVDATHFNVPNLKKRTIFGYAPGDSVMGGGLDTQTLGATGGVDTDPGQSISSTGNTAPGSTDISAAGAGGFAGGGPGTPDHQHTIGALSVTVTGNTATASNIPPAIVLQYVISTGVPV